MMEPVYIGVDLGTQSVRAMAVTQDGTVVASATQPLHSQREGVRHQQDPKEWWQASAQALREVMDNCGTGRDVLGVALDATSGTILLVDATGAPLTPGLMYDDGRAREETAEVSEKGSELWNELGYRIQASWGLPKLLWLKKNGLLQPGVRLLHQNDWLHLRLSGRMLSTDSSHALKTGYDLLRSRWPEDIFDRLGIPLSTLPQVVKPGTRIGEVDASGCSATGLPCGTPIFAGMTDGCAAQIASGATSVGSWNTVIGTTLVVKGVTQELLRDPLGAVYSHRSMDGLWLPGGASNTGAGSIATNFAADDLPRLNHYAETHGPSQLIVYPLVGRGERFPFAAPEANGFTLGTPSSTEELYCGVLQGIALWERLSFDALRALNAPTNGRFTISGGATRSRALNQLRADILERELHVAAITEGAFGMAVLISAAKTNITEATKRMVHAGESIAPKRSFADYEDAYRKLLQALHQRGWLPDHLMQTVQKGSAA
ncbi:MAG TPA: FGGY family carbohydrate kinase [Edaphobacter sp.]